MRATHLIIALLFAVPQRSAAQTDSVELQEIVLKEVIIQAATNANQRRFSPDKNIQAGTDQILNKSAGVSMIKRGNYAWEPGIRGLTQGRIITTIDGMAIFGACTDRMDPVSSYIEPSNLKSISISYSNSDQAAGNTIGGGFDFKINQPVFSSKKVFTGMASAGYETNGNGRQVVTSLNYGEKRFALNVNGIYRSSANYYGGGGKLIANSQFSKWNGGIGMKLKLDNHNSILVNYIQDEGYNIGYPALTMDVRFAKAKIFSVTHQLHLMSDIFNKVETKAYFNTIDHAMDDTKRPAAQVAMHMDMPGTSQTAGLLSVMTGQVRKHHFRTKANLYENRLHAEMTMYPKGAAPMYMLTLPDAKRAYYELAMSDNWEISEKISIQSSFSASMALSSLFSQAGKQTVSGTLGQVQRRSNALYSASLSPVIQLKKPLSLFATVGYTMRAPVLQELYGFYLFNRPDNYDYLGNPLLKNEKSWNLSAGIDLKTKAFSASTKVFAYDIRDYIVGIIRHDIGKMTHGADGVKQYQNIAGAVLAGFEAEAVWKIDKLLRLSTVNSFTYGRDNDGFALAQVPPFRSVDAVTVSWRSFEFRPEVILNASQNHVSDKYGEMPSPSSAIINIGVDKVFEMGTKRFCVKVVVENLLDAQYYDHLDVMKFLRPGRNISLQAALYF